VASPSVVVLLVGASVPDGVDTVCVHTAGWFVRRLGVAILDVAEREVRRPLSQDLASAISNVSALHMRTCHLNELPGPSAAVAILREQEEMVDFLVFGNVTVVLDESLGIRVVSGTQLEEPTHVEQRALNKHVGELPNLGKPDRGSADFSGVGSNYLITDYALTGTTYRRGLRRAALLSNGAAQLLNDLGSVDWLSWLNFLEENGSKNTIHRPLEFQPPNPERPNLHKIQHDTTAVMCYFRDDA
jgi:hypothetical protein